MTTHYIRSCFNCFLSLLFLLLCSNHLLAQQASIKPSDKASPVDISPNSSKQSSKRAYVQKESNQEAKSLLNATISERKLGSTRSSEAGIGTISRRGKYNNYNINDNFRGGHWKLDVSAGDKEANISDALKQAYETNPQLSAQRANTRGIDENLQIALGSFMPKVYGQGTALTQSFNLLSPRYDQTAFGRDGADLKTNPTPVYAGVTAALNVFNGFKGVNGVNQAEAQIHQSRELLRTSEISVFLAAIQSYMSVLNDLATYKIRLKYAQIVSQQLGVSRDKVKSGEISSTDTSEIESYLAQGERNVIAANTALSGSLAFYKRVTGKAPGRLTPAKPIQDKLPKTLDESLRMGFRDHPLVIAARYNVDINKYAVKMAEANLLPTVDLVAGYGQNWNYFGTQGQRLYQGGGGVQINVPFYDGGVSYGGIRQAKQRVGESESLYDFQISQIRQQIETNWAAWQNSSILLDKARLQVARAEEALAGLRYEIGFGLRTTWDVLNYQQILTEARVSMINAQRDRVIASYNLLASIGGLSAQNLNLDTSKYDPREHYNRVKMQMIGTDPW